MTWPIETADLGARLDYKNDRISDSDALRQLRTITAILRRLPYQPGIVLADEVGMGKTFVALGVAMAAAFADRGKRPVVIMVPSSVHEKWPRDFLTFTDRVIKLPQEKALRADSAESALGFFRLIAKPANTRPQIIFLKYGAFHVGNIDQWVRLALIKRAIQGMHLGEKRNALPRFAARLLRTKSSYNEPELFDKLLNRPSHEWRDIINRHCLGRPNFELLPDDPIPDAIQKVIDSSDIDILDLRKCLKELPARESASIDERLESTRCAINDALKSMWPSTLAKVRFRSPLVILDEAHHLKNPTTKLASLFVAENAENGSSNISGALDGAFERMMFLTATPFQLGHHELINVIGRFKGIAWKTLPQVTKAGFEAELQDLESTLNRAQHRAAELDKRWLSLRQDDLIDQNGASLAVEEWWQYAAVSPEKQSERVQVLMRAFEQTRKAMKEAEIPLRKWVVRHLRDSKLPDTNTLRRSRHIGRAISLANAGDGGLPVENDALLPFLLAARAQAVVAGKGESAGRATFAEGLSSSYEAFLETRNQGGVDEEEASHSAPDERVNRYVKKLTAALPDEAAYAQHPKIAPVVARVLDLWRQREKVVVFCHYRETGRALVRHLSAALECQLWNEAAQRFGMDHQAVQKAVADFGGRFDTEGGMRDPLDKELARRLAPYLELSSAEQELILDVVRRFVRTPLFVARYFDIHARSGGDTLQAALDTRDMSGASLSEKINAFLKFIAKRCSSREREAYLDALHRMQPGIRGEAHRDKADDLSQMSGVSLMPNIRLANGLVKQETRQRLMLAFNTPFFPEVLVASSVLAEGVDLHLSCRHVIHHALSWNPSTLEQRTGRVDRIGSKAETVAKPIEVFLPYIGGTQDEKQFRVVMDRERWFQVLMGENYPTDESHTEKSVERIPLPLAAAEALAFDLSVELK